MAARLKGTKRLRRFLEREIKAATVESVDKIGQFSVRYIRGRTREGDDLPREGSQPPLKPSTVKIREYLARFNSTPRFFSPGKSNLTLTGQLLRSLFYRVDEAEDKVRLTIDVKDNKRRAYKTANGPGKDRPTNQQVAEWLAEIGRLFIGLDDRGIQTIRQIVLREVRKKLRQLRRR